MSTKTTLKRIALVTVAALSFGMVSSISANAATYITGSGGQLYCSVSLEADANGSTTCTGSAGGQVVMKFENYSTLLDDAVNALTAEKSAGLITITSTTAHGFSAGMKITADFNGTDFDATNVTISAATSTTFQYTVGSNTVSSAAISSGTANAWVPTFYVNTAATFVSLPTATTTAPTWTNNVNGVNGVTWSPASHTQTLTMVLSNATAGDTALVVSYNSLVTGVSISKAAATVSWLGATSLAASVQYSTLFRSATLTGWPTATDAAPITVSRSLNSTTALPVLRAVAVLTTKNANNQALFGSTATVAVSGPGLVSIHPGSTGGTADCTGPMGASVTRAATAAQDYFGICIYSDGTSGVGTFTVSAGSVVINSFTVTFYGSVATLKATQILKIARSANSTAAALGCSLTACGWTTVADHPAVLIEALDANGVRVPSQTIVGISADPTVIASAAVSANTTSADYNGANAYNASVTSAVGSTSGKSTTVTFRVTVGSSYVYSDPITFTLGGSIATGKVSWAFDKSSYAPGEAGTITITAVDSAGNPIYDQNVVGLFAAAPVFSKSVIAPSAIGTDYLFLSGKTSKSFYAPTVDGPFSVSGVLDTTADAGATATISSSVTGANAVAEAAADAAAEAIDAANAATDAANLAAEAADAATVAAEEARDAADAATAAIEELATQVATLMAALKAQITTLANTVAKIAKKVKA